MKGNTMLSRFYVLLCILALLISALAPVSALAEADGKNTFTFSDTGVTVAGEGTGYKIDGTDLEITEPGAYTLTGACANGSVTVAKSLTGVTIILEDLNLTSTYTAPIVCSKSTEVTIRAVGTSTLKNNEDPDAGGTEGAGIKVKGSSTLTLTGSGTLSVYGNCKNGIKGAAGTEIIVSDLYLNIDAVNNALASDGSVVINGGVLSLKAGNDAIKSEPEVDDTESKGTVTINGGNITVNSTGDAVQATGAVTITWGLLKLTTGGGYMASVGEDSAKGIKSATEVKIYGGIIILNCADDAIHSDGNVRLLGGNYSINSGGDAVHADYNIDIGTFEAKGPDIYIYSCYEGFEGAVVNMYSGNGTIVSSDDGINAANSDLGNYPFKIMVYGGKWHINAGGDGIDSNGDIYLYGGVIESFGSSGNNDSALDYDGSCYYAGGTILAVGMSGMAQTSLNGVSVIFGRSTGGPGGGGGGGGNSSVSIRGDSQIVIKDASGATVYTATGVKNANCVQLAADDLVSGAAYSLYVDGILAATANATGTRITAPAVLGVTISPEAITVEAGDAYKFTAKAIVSNGPSEELGWTVTGGSASTAIASDGTLKVAADETADTLTVTATSVYNTSKYAEAVVNVVREVKTYTVTATAGPNGKISPPGEVTVVEGGSQTFIFTPDEGYYVANIMVDGVHVGSIMSSYTFSDVTKNHTIEVEFESENSFRIDPMVTISRSTGGNIGGCDLPRADETHSIEIGMYRSPTFTFVPDEGYVVSDVLVDGVSVGAVSSYTFHVIRVDHTLRVEFAKETPGVKTYTVTATAGPNGSISPSGEVSVIEGGSQTFIFTPDEGYYVANVMVDGVHVGRVMSTYTISDITKNYTIEVEFEREDIARLDPVVTVSRSAGGNISECEVPGADVTVGIEIGWYLSPTFTFVPDEGYVVSDVLVDGVSVGAVSSYTFHVLRENHTLRVEFAEETPGVRSHTIIATAGVGGNIYHNGTMIYSEGEDATFYIIADSGYLISDVLVDGVSVGATNTYVFTNLTADHTITAEFISTTERFKDLKPDAWYLEAIERIVNYGLFEGVSDTGFDPDGNMSRAMFVQVLMRLSNKIGIDTSGDFTNSFKDVKSGGWYEAAVCWAAARGLVTGYDADTFGPDDSITREQMAAMLIRFLDYAEVPLKTMPYVPFADAEKISSWARDAVQRAAGGGLVNGLGDGRFDPLSTATRAQVATLFGNLLDNYLA